MGVTEEDRLMVDYFIREKGDITRWSAWEQRKPVIAAEYPELIAALKQVTIAERTLDAVVERFVEER